jgi:hypothetical protein
VTTKHNQAVSKQNQEVSKHKHNQAVTTKHKVKQN